MNRQLAPYQERRIVPTSDNARSWPRRREYAWMALTFALACLLVVGPLDFEAAQVTESIVEEEDARIAGLVGEVIAARHAGDPRDLPQRQLSLPLRCLEPYEQVLVQWGDGLLPWQRQKDGKPGVRCTNADLRRGYAR